MNGVIQIDEKTRIRRIDPLNWTVEFLKDCKTKDDEPYTEWRQANGNKFGPFCRSAADAVAWLLDYRYGDSGFNGDLKLAIAEYRHIADDLKHAVERAVRR